MDIPNWSVVIIAKNEANTLPRCMASLEEFRVRGGEVIVVDTGSTDNTASIARAFGCRVTEVGDKFIKVLDEELTKKLNDTFVVEGEEPIVKGGNRLFDFASARNYATSLASHDMICTLDADEVYSIYNIDRLNALIAEGYEQFEYSFIFAFDQYGKPAVQFIQCKFFDRRKLQWKQIIHECLFGEAKRLLLSSDVILLEHHQEQGKEHRGNYLAGLALDCHEHPNGDRAAHYFSREMMYHGRPKSAIKEFERHITMGGWPAERAQSHIFIGDCYGMLKQQDKQLASYSKAFSIDPNRREALIKLARVYRNNQQWTPAIAYATAALEIPKTDYYANDQAMYTQEPHEILYFCHGWNGNIVKAREHILKALEYQRWNPAYLRDTRYYFEYPANYIQGWLSYAEQLFLFNMAKEMESVIELGSWKGKSTHALCSSGCPKIIAIDTWKGSAAEPEAHAEAKDDSVFEEFKKNVGHFKNLTIIQKDINTAVLDIPDKSVDVVWIDAGHTYDEVKNDIRKWKSKAKILICGHDYCPEWPGVIQSVDEELGEVEVCDTIWFKYLI